jgi:hypothetical protein
MARYARKGEREVHVRVFCIRSGCGRVARWHSPASGADYCGDHAADFAPYVVLKPIEGVEVANPRLRIVDAL